MIESKIERWMAAHTDDLPLSIVLPSGREFTAQSPPKVRIIVRKPAAYGALLSRTLASLAEAYVQQDIDLEGSVENIIAVGTRMTEDTGGGEEKLSLLSRLLAHTRSRDKKAIEYHYDVGNDFYQLFLDERMVYSCAYFRSEQDSLDQAQLNKLDHILDKLQLTAGDRFLDIGCGWGALVIRAAERGANAVGITLSQNQFDYAQRLIAEKGFQGRCEVRLQDYRDVPEARGFDKIASVGMFEHVGVKNFPMYFGRVAELLKHGGVTLIHGITSPSSAKHKVEYSSGDFIERYVFPDGELAHVTVSMAAMNDAGLEVVDAESLRRHYARTLALWAERFETNAQAARENAGETRYRIWRVYLAGCTHGFAQNWVNIYQLLAIKAGGPALNPLPMTRDWMYRS